MIISFKQYQREKCFYEKYKKLWAELLKISLERLEKQIKAELKDIEE